MTTTVLPSSVRGVDASTSSAMRTPASAHLRTISWCQSTWNQAVTASAMTPPTPSARASSSVDGRPDRVHRAEVGRQRPCRRGPDVADGQRHEHAPERLRLGLLELGEQLLAAGGEHPAVDDRVGGVGLLRRPGVERHRRELLAGDAVVARVRAVGGRGEEVALVGRRCPTRAGRSSPPSRAPRCRGRRAPRARRCARAAGSGTSASWGTGCPCRPPSPGRAGCRRRGTRVGMTKARSDPSRRSTTGPTISGMTSPALRSTTVSPMSTPLRSTS